MADRSRFGRTQLYPAVRFPVYGLNSPFPGPRWLSLFGDPPDGSPTWLTLDHRSADGVDGVLVQASVWRFAGGWTAFTDAAAGVYLIVVGAGPGTGPEDLSFAALRDASAYHFNLQGPLSLEIAEASAEAAGVRVGPDPSWQRQDWHRDQLQLIRERGSGTPTSWR